MAGFLLSESELRAHGGVKWRKYPADVMPAFVAEMDFKVAPAVQAAFERLVQRSDYGYGAETDLPALFAAFTRWSSRRYGWNPDPALTISAADVIQEIVAALVAYSNPDDGIIVQTPSYPPFLKVIATTGRRLVENPLVLRDRYEIDFDGLRHVAIEGRVLLFCNPQNPTGRVLERQELEEIGAIAAEHDLTIVSDEIHADISYVDTKHIPMEAIAPERTVTLTSATKSFNIPGARAAIMHFGTAELMERFVRAIPDFLLGRPSRFGVDATIAAWTDSDEWFEEVMRYLAANRALVSQWAARHDLVGYRAPEATFLAWLDCRRLRLPGSPFEFFLQSARVGLSDGSDFGTPGVGHVRLNFGTSTEILTKVLDRMEAALVEG